MARQEELAKNLEEARAILSSGTYLRGSIESKPEDMTLSLFICLTWSNLPFMGFVYDNKIYSVSVTNEDWEHDLDGVINSVPSMEVYDIIKGDPNHVQVDWLYREVTEGEKQRIRQYYYAQNLDNIDFPEDCIMGVVLDEGVDVPKYSRAGDAGMDLRAKLLDDKGNPSEYTLKPFERKLFKTGIRFDLPEGVEAQVRSRSGMTLKHGVVVANGVGTIDPNYQGDCGVILLNLSTEPYTIKHNDRVAQVVFAQFMNMMPVKFNCFATSNRGEKGFGSSGKK